ncbi:MAG: chloramphenicol acetyltransferase [Bacteroidota bacterium]
MKQIDLSTWNRRKHFAYFNSLDYPPYNLTANVDITALHGFAKAQAWSLFRCTMYITCRAANEIEAFRQRVREGQVVQHEAVHPSYTSMTKAQVFSFTEADYHPDPQVFFANCDAGEAAVAEEAMIADDQHRDDYLFLTSIPWVHFTSFVHPVHISGVDSVPRISWGKYLWIQDRLQLPLSMQAHHALVDGWHMGQFFQKVEEMAAKPGDYLAG